MREGGCKNGAFVGGGRRGRKECDNHGVIDVCKAGKRAVPWA